MSDLPLACALFAQKLGQDGQEASVLRQQLLRLYQSLKQVLLSSRGQEVSESCVRHVCVLAQQWSQRFHSAHQRQSVLVCGRTTGARSPFAFLLNKNVFYQWQVACWCVELRLAHPLLRESVLQRVSPDDRAAALECVKLQAVESPDELQAWVDSESMAREAEDAQGQREVQRLRKHLDHLEGVCRAERFLEVDGLASPSKHKMEKQPENKSPDPLDSKDDAKTKDHMHPMDDDEDDRDGFPTYTREQWAKHLAAAMERKPVDLSRWRLVAYTAHDEQLDRKVWIPPADVMEQTWALNRTSRVKYGFV